METNKAPNKIYLYLSDRAGEDFDNEWGIMPLGEDSIEYTRTDALIEKVAEWINEHTSLSEKLVIENFKKYMEE